MKKGYYHSKNLTSIWIGGRCTAKIARNINSASLEVKKKGIEEYTTMREIVMKKEIEGKALFKSMVVTPTEGNKGLMMMAVQ